MASPEPSASDSYDQTRKERRKKHHKREKEDSSTRKRRRDDKNHGKSDDDEHDEDRQRDKKKKKSSRGHHSSKHKKKHNSSGTESNDDDAASKQKIVNERLLAKLAARGETLEERNARRAQKRAALVTSKFGYTADDNPFNDPNLHETFVWKKREEIAPKEKKQKKPTGLEEIEKVRRRRKERELQREELERIRAEENRMKELENYDEWARKEEEFHLQQQRQKSAIRLVEGREKPIDVLAKNLLMFGNSDEDREISARVKYKERYNALEELSSLEAELDEPQNLLKALKLSELEELLRDIDTFYTLEREASISVSTMRPDEAENPLLRYWEALRIVAEDEIKLLKSGGENGLHAKLVKEIEQIFKGQSVEDLQKMGNEINEKLMHSQRKGGTMTDDSGNTFDADYWKSVSDQLDVYLAKRDLSDLHSKMLVRQLERLEKKRLELSKEPVPDQAPRDEKPEAESTIVIPDNVSPGFGDLEDELGLADEVDVSKGNYRWEDKYRPRKPRYFNRVKTGFDWNSYNKTHYDSENPPPKIVQGYKFNIFYPDLIDPTKTPQYFLEPADSSEFCIIRFHAGPPYEDIAFKIINREWNRKKKSGFKCTFERGVLSLYFNFATHWYRR